MLKAVAVLNLIDADDLLPTEAVLRAAFAPINTHETVLALATLKDNGLLFQRGPTYRLWPNGSVSLEKALDAAARAVGPVETVAAGLDLYLDHDPNSCSATLHRIWHSPLLRAAICAGDFPYRCVAKANRSGWPGCNRARRHQ